MSHASVTRPLARRRGRIVLVLTVWAACLAGAGAAQAAITTSNITAPADGSLLLYSSDSTAAQNVAVSGTSNGTTGDAVDIRCYLGSSVESAGPSGTDVAVHADGSFSASIPLSDFPGSFSCTLAAVPTGTTPKPPTGFTGPRVGISAFGTDTIGGNGPNSTDKFGFYFFDSTVTGYTESDGTGFCGVGQLVFDGTPAMNYSPTLLACAGSLLGAVNDYSSPGGFDLTRSDIEVDGQNAYATYGPYSLFSGSASIPGFPSLTATLDAFDQTTGNAQTTESETFVKCSPSDVYNPTSSDCTSFVSTGVRFQRVIDYTDSGRVATVTDTYTSTDGAAHSLDLEYEADLDSSAAGWELPGQSSFTQHATGDTGAAPTSAPGTIYAVYDTAQSPSLTNPVAAMTFASPYNSIRFDDTLMSGETSGLIDYQRSVPAGGSVTIQWSYATGTSLGEVQGYAASADDLFSPPTISITSPSSGAMLTGAPVTVTGTASAASGIHSVTVNGVAATVSAGKFTASVPLVLGSNTIKATVTTDSGATESASETVSYTGPAPVVATGAASRVGSSTAKVSGTVTPGATAASYYFQYGKTTAYGHQTATTPIAAATSASSVSATLRGLGSHSTYHYRLVATNAAGTSYGTDRTFKTLYALRGLTLKVSRRGAHSYHVTGALKLPKGVSEARGCHGTVTIRAKKAGSHRAKVTKRCTYSANVPTHLKGHGKLTFTATFAGNSLIAPFTAPSVKARLG